jgi:hypothetical protein
MIACGLRGVRQWSVTVTGYLSVAVPPECEHDGDERHCCGVRCACHQLWVGPSSDTRERVTIYTNTTRYIAGSQSSRSQYSSSPSARKEKKKLDPCAAAVLHIKHFDVWPLLCRLHYLHMDKKQFVQVRTKSNTEHHEYFRMGPGTLSQQG